MKRYEFHFSDTDICKTESFAEASASELRVYIALLSLNGSADDEELSSLAGVSRSRCASALSLWQEAGVIIPRHRETGEYKNNLTDEFEASLGGEDVYEKPAEHIAKQIRDKKLAGLISECTALLGKTDLTPKELKQVVSLVSDYGVCPEYILTYATYLCDKGGFTVNRLFCDIKRLSSDGVLSVEELSAYLSELEKRKGMYSEFRKLLGIYDRSLSKTEEGYINRWYVEFGYGLPVISEAYDITVLNTNKGQLKYMDALLTDWFSSGCKTAEDCKTRYAEAGERKTAERAENRPQRQRKSKPEKARYGDFDPEEVFKMALARSYGEEKATDILKNSEKK